MKIFLSCLAVVFSAIVYPQREEIFNGVQFGESLETVSQKLSTHSGKLYDKQASIVSFPLAATTEVHLICLDCKTANGIVEEVAFTFADDQLSLIQAKGKAIKTIIEKRRDSAQSFMQYTVFWDELIIADEKEDKVWFLTEESAHPNLYAWDNPYLPSHGGKEVTYATSAAIPDFITMGGPMDQLKPLLEEASSFTFGRELGPDDPNAQYQLDCFGLEFAGFPRKFEARFGDGKLNTVWILTAKGEEDRIRKRLVQEFGSAIYKNEAWEVFNNWEVFLRKDKPEVLLLTPELGAYYKKEYFKQEN